MWILLRLCLYIYKFYFDKLIKNQTDDQRKLTTKQYDFYDRHFEYKSDYDKNGICYFLGTNYGENNKWKNPAILNKIKLKSSGWSLYGSINAMVERATKWSYSKDIKNGWVSFDLLSLQIKPTHYTLRHFDRDGWYMKSWNLLGSLDGTNYEIIKKHGNKTSPFTFAEQSITFKIENVDKYYRHFKIQITAMNCGAYNYLVYPDWRITFNGFEIYGYVRGNKI